MMDEHTEAAVRQFLSLLEDRFPIESAWLFGSRARGTHAPDSDADIAVVLGGTPTRLVDTALAMTDMAYDVFLATGVDISPMPIWLGEWEHPERCASPTLVREIAATGVRL